MPHPLVLGLAGVGSGSVAETVWASSQVGAGVLALATTVIALRWRSPTMLLGAALGGAALSLRHAQVASLVLLAALTGATIARALPPMDETRKLAVAALASLVLLPVFRAGTESMTGALHATREERAAYRVATAGGPGVVYATASRALPAAPLWRSVRWRPAVGLHPLASGGTQVRADVMELYERARSELHARCEALAASTHLVVCGSGTGGALALLCAVEQSARRVGPVSCVVFDPIRVGSEEFTLLCERVLRTCIKVLRPLSLPALPQVAHGGLFPAPGSQRVRLL